MKKKKKIIEDWRITPSEDMHDEWIINTIKARHPNAIFAPERWNQKIDWESIEKQVNHIDTLATYMQENEMPPLLFKSYIDLLHTNLQVLRDLFFVNTGFHFDPMEQGEIQNMEDFKKLRFWTLQDLEVTTRLCNVFQRLYQYDGLSRTYGSPDFEGAWDDVEETLKDTESDDEIPRLIGQQRLKNPKSWCMTYAFAPYENREGVEQTSTIHQCLSVSLYISTFFNLFFQLSVIYQIEEESLPELVDELRRSEYGENRMKPWRKDMNVSKEEFITKMEAIYELRPWVRGVAAVLEEKQHLRSLFSQENNPGYIDVAKCSNIRSWISVVVIAALLKEYDEEQKVVRQLTPFFFLGENSARDFLNRIRGAEPQMITALVKKLVDEVLLNEYIKGKKLYDVLHENGLYTKSYQNWSSQV